MPTLVTSITKLQNIYLQVKGELEAKNGTVPDMDTVLEEMMFSEYYIDDLEKYFISTLTNTQLKDIFINRVLH